MKLKNILIDQLQGDFTSITQYHNTNISNWYVVIHVSDLRQKYVARIPTICINRCKNAKKPFITITSNNAKNKALHRLRTFLTANNVRFNVSSIENRNIMVLSNHQYEIISRTWTIKAISI